MRFVDVELIGRLDGYWCDHLDAALSDVIREGSHHIRVDCAQVSFLTSAGVGVLVKFYQQLNRINGTFQVVNPSHPRRQDSAYQSPRPAAARAARRRRDAGGSRAVPSD